MQAKRKKRLTVDEYTNGILSGNKVILSRAITLSESTLPEDIKLSTKVVDGILANTGNSIRLGITGVPGVGKSTFIESLGKHLTSQGKKLAVLAIDPSSQKSGGSILGDKTRMETLSADPNAYIRPTASRDNLGGVAHKTREAMLLCEAAGYDVILIETVGVGQSEVAVKGMVDFFLLLMLAGAGDELQGIKKGIMEMADGIAITKSDGDNLKAAKRAKAEYENALHLFPPSEAGWYPKVITCSALKHSGVQQIWEMVTTHQEYLLERGILNEQRQQQNVSWMHEVIGEQLKNNFYSNLSVKDDLDSIIDKVKSGKMSAKHAAAHLMSNFLTK